MTPFCEEKTFSPIRKITLIFALLFAATVLSCTSKPIHFDEVKWRKGVKDSSLEKLYAPHFRDGRYFNPWAPREHRGFFTFLKWKFSKRATYSDEEEAFIPNVIPHLKARIESIPGKDFIAWIGHATFLIRLEGEYWITDPIFSNRALLPKRVTPPAINAEELLDLTDEVNVIISHNHYDHLDVESIRSMPPKSRFFVPLGLKKYVESFHDSVVRELDWWESIDIKGGTKLICLPAQHWSRRIGQRVNSTLWASYMLVTPKTTIYYGADSGYFKGYQEIGRKYQDIDYALLPVTAYHPRWFMHYAHMNSVEALDAFKDLGAKHFLPTQWGTFHLGEEPPGYPVLDLLRIIGEKKLDSSRFVIMDIGQIEVISK